MTCCFNSEFALTIESFGISKIKERVNYLLFFMTDFFLFVGNISSPARTHKHLILAVNILFPRLEVPSVVKDVIRRGMRSDRRRSNFCIIGLR